MKTILKITMALVSLISIPCFGENYATEPRTNVIIDDIRVIADCGPFIGQYYYPAGGMHKQGTQKDRIEDQLLLKINVTTKEFFVTWVGNKDAYLHWKSKVVSLSHENLTIELTTGASTEIFNFRRNVSQVMQTQMRTETEIDKVGYAVADCHFNII